MWCANYPCYDQCSFRDTVKPVFIPGDYSRRHTRLAETRMAKNEAQRNNKLNE